MEGEDGELGNPASPPFPAQVGQKISENCQTSLVSSSTTLFFFLGVAADDDDDDGDSGGGGGGGALLLSSSLEVV